MLGSGRLDFKPPLPNNESSPSSGHCVSQPTVNIQV
jgi:hypothetical protein